MNEKLKAYLQRVVKGELKWMYHYDIDDDMFGAQTDIYQWCTRVLAGDLTIEELIEYFRTYYGSSEKTFLARVQEITNAKEE